MSRKQILLIGAGSGALLLAGLGFLAMHHSSGEKKGKEEILSSAQDSESSNAKLLFAQAERARVQGSLVEAKQLYQQVLHATSSSELALAAQNKLGEVNIKILFSSVPTPDSIVYEIQPGDSFFKIAKKFHTTVDLLKAANGLTTDRLRSGQRLKITRAAFSVIVDKSQNIVTLKNGEDVLKIYHCSTGAGGNTPVGNFHIVNRIVNPPWYTPEGVLPAADPRNVLGTRWMGFDQPGYGIHGTTDPSSIGKSVTKGCVRLANNEVEELFVLLPEGTPVTIVD